VNRQGAKLPSVAYGDEAKPAGGCCGGHGPGGHGAHDATVVLWMLLHHFHSITNL
jgi:hypothetical protein